jgi:hypothetical protein
MEARSNLKKNLYFQVMEQCWEFAVTDVIFKKTEHYFVFMCVWKDELGLVSALI